MGDYYKIKIAVGDISFELESHDKEWVESKQKELAGELLSSSDSVRKLSQSQEVTATSVEPARASLTINEFYQQYIGGKNWTRPKIALFLIYYMEKMQGSEAVATIDLKNAFREIAYPKYDKFNFTDILSQLKKKGQLNKIDGKWKLTITGIDYVVSELQAG